jgi:DNA-binding HxlR family transcriptional regulator
VDFVATRVPKTPIPGQPVRGSSSGRPVMALLDLLGRRWTLRILWELRDQKLHFRALQSACDEVSPSVLNARIAELREARLVELQTEGGYALTKQGRELLSKLAPLATWAGKWAGTVGSGK